MKTLLREKELKDINIEEMRVVTHVRHVAEQIKRDKGGERRDECSQKWRSWKIGKLQN